MNIEGNQLKNKNDLSNIIKKLLLYRAELCTGPGIYVSYRFLSVLFHFYF